MHIHILGICGTFMGGIALIAKQAGHKVTGSDQNVYPPMSDELKEAGIEIYQGYGAEQLDCKPDLIVVGNVMKRGMPVIERMLDERFNYVSGPGFLEDLYLRSKTVLAVSGTHGKTTTSAMLTWILEYAKKNPGFLVGGIPENFGYSARSSDSEYFVIEADEYDCAFFDKRSKFVHYHPNIAIINNIEFDHADIFNSIEDIKKQFHQMVRIIPSSGTVIYPAHDQNVVDTIKKGLWSKPLAVGDSSCPYQLRIDKEDGSKFSVLDTIGELLCSVELNATGLHNAHNAFMALLAAHEVGVDFKEGAQALGKFKMPKRRMELVGEIGNIKVYDDFAHHPTAIATTIEGLRKSVGADKHIICVFEPRSNSMKMGANSELLGASFKDADEVFVYQNEAVSWDMSILVRDCPKPLTIVDTNTANLIDQVVVAATAAATKDNTYVIVMSNGGFENVKGRLVEALKQAKNL